MVRWLLVGWLVALGCSEGPPAPPDFSWRAGERSFSTTGGGLTARWEAGEVHVGATTFGVPRLEREGWASPGATSGATVTGALLQSRRGEVLEEWLHGPVGLEVRWRFPGTPGGRGDLTVEIPIGSASVQSSSAGVQVSSPTSQLAVGHGTFIDATGRRTPVLARAGVGSVAWVVPKAVLEETIWPAILDPLIQPVPFTDRESLSPVRHPAKQRASASVQLPSGAWVVVWEDERVKPGSTDIFGVMAADGSQTAFRASRSGQATDPDIAVRADGTWLVVWREPSRVMGALGGGPTFSPFTVETGFVSGPARVAATSEGFIVVWSRGLRIDGARLSAAGMQAPGFVIAQTPGDSPAVSASGDTVSVVFETTGGTQLRQGQLQGTASINWQPRPLPMPNGGGRRPAVLSTDREVIVGWEFQSTDGWEIEAYRSTDGGLTRNQVANMPGDDETGLSLSSLSNGSSLAAWSRRGQGRVFTRVLQQDGGVSIMAETAQDGREARLSPTNGNLSWTFEEDIWFEQRGVGNPGVVSLGSEVQDQPAVAIADAGSVIVWAGRSTGRVRYRTHYAPADGGAVRALVIDAGVPHNGLSPAVAMEPTGLALAALPGRRALELELHGAGGVIGRGALDGGWVRPSVAWLGTRWAVAAEIDGLGVAVALGPPDGGLPMAFGPLERDSSRPQVLPSLNTNQVGLLSRVDMGGRLVVGPIDPIGAPMLPVFPLAFPVQAYQLVPHGSGLAVASLSPTRDLTARVHGPPTFLGGPEWSPPGLRQVESFAIASDGVSAPLLWSEELPDGGEVVWATRLFPDGGTTPQLLRQGEAERDLAIACAGRRCVHAGSSWAEPVFSTRLSAATVVTNEPPQSPRTTAFVEALRAFEIAFETVDRDGDPISYTIQQAPAAGQLTLDAGRLRYEAPAMPGTYVAQLVADDGYEQSRGLFSVTVFAGTNDAGVVDGGFGILDAGVLDPDGGVVDAGATDAGAPDGGPGDRDGGLAMPDGGGTVDPDAGAPSDAGSPPDAGPLEERFVPVSCGCGTVDAMPWLMAGALVIGRRRRMKPPAV